MRGLSLTVAALLALGGSAFGMGGGGGGSAYGGIGNMSTATFDDYATAKEFADRMTAEAVAFKDFLQRSNDSERANLRLHVGRELGRETVQQLGVARHRL